MAVLSVARGASLSPRGLRLLQLLVGRAAFLSGPSIPFCLFVSSRSDHLSSGPIGGAMEVETDGERRSPCRRWSGARGCRMESLVVFGYRSPDGAPMQAVLAPVCPSCMRRDRDVPMPISCRERVRVVAPLDVGATALSSELRLQPRENRRRGDVPAAIALSTSPRNALFDELVHLRELRVQVGPAEVGRDNASRSVTHGVDDPVRAAANVECSAAGLERYDADRRRLCGWRAGFVRQRRARCSHASVQKHRAAGGSQDYGDDSARIGVCTMHLSSPWWHNDIPDSAGYAGM
jgi:hypothetical protein